MHAKMYEKIYSFHLFTWFLIGNIQINLDFYVRVRAYEKRVSGKQP